MTTKKVLTPMEQKKQVEQQIELIKAFTRTGLGLIVVAGSFVLVYSGREIPAELWYVVLAAVGGIYGFEGVLNLIKRQNGKEK